MNEEIKPQTALESNILAVKTLSNILKSTLGPRGKDKLLIGGQNNEKITITNDGATILKEMKITHPLARLIIDSVKTLEREVGDGTTTLTLLIGTILEQAESLMKMGIHPSQIIKYFNEAQEFLINKLNEISGEITDIDFKQLVKTTITGKGAEPYDYLFSELLIQAKEKVKNKKDILINGIKLDGVENTELINGIVIDKKAEYFDMVEEIKDAKVLLIDFDLDIKNPEIDTQIQLHTPEDVDMFRKADEKIMRDYIEKIEKTGANVVFCNKNINDFILYELVKRGMIAIRRVNKYYMDYISRVTGAKITASFQDLDKKRLGNAGKIRRKVLEEDERIFIEECKENKLVTILIHGTSKQLIEEIKRAVEDCVGVIYASDEGIVVGGGSIEMYLSRQLKDEALKFEGKKQIIYEALANSLEIIPATLSDSSGLNTLEILTKLRKKYKEGEKYLGVDFDKGEIGNLLAKGVLEPKQIKESALKGALELVNMVLRIDDNIPINENEST